MESKLEKRTMERFGRAMLAATVTLGAFLWLGSVRSDHGKAAASNSAIEKTAPPQTTTPIADADKDTLDLQLD
jgi:hypothetical protein